VSGRRPTALWLVWERAKTDGARAERDRRERVDEPWAGNVRCSTSKGSGRPIAHVANCSVLKRAIPASVRA